MLLGIERIKLLRSRWYWLAHEVVRACSEVVEVLEAYVFGSVIKGGVSGGSDLDVLIVVPKGLNRDEVKVKMYEVLESRLGDLSYLIDLHVVSKDDVGKPPYSWFVREGIKVF